MTPTLFYTTITGLADRLQIRVHTYLNIISSSDIQSKTKLNPIQPNST